MSSSVVPLRLVSAEVPEAEAAAPPSATSAVQFKPLLIDINGLGQLLDRSVPSLYRDEAAGRLPAAQKLGGSKRWRYAEIVSWVEAGMPSRKVWEARKQTKA